ncbi:hypothetical protein GH810_06995 [Acetobacterium paludosum]|uniref:Uncharacterized protein n=1 Tax=Acetobacterium paludosum TaxID=52693 RepID=A0A923KS70_9FIRM|nr:DUF6323 family protein [Acetobacterium paludosum]MBC3888052.1 hypothetical protein [Acetobacterium paludosum]
MSFNLMLFDNALVQKQAVSEIMLCNEIIDQYSLALTEASALELVETRSYSLENLGRIEFGGGIIGKIIIVFCDSPYLSQDNFEGILHELIEIFYYYKNETLDLMSDDDLINYMKMYFDGVCHGSLDQLKFTELDRMARNVRFGYNPDYNELEEAIKKEMEAEEKEENNE